MNMTIRFVTAVMVVTASLACSGDELIRLPSNGPLYSWNNYVGLPGGSGNADGIGGDARFYMPYDVAMDSQGNVFVADYLNHTIRKITPGGVVSTFAGSAGQYGSDDGTGSAARFYTPTGIGIDINDNIFVAGFRNHIIRKITPAGVVTTVAGSAGNTGSTDGTGSTARFEKPVDVAADRDGNLYVTDFNNHTIRKIVVSTREVTTFAGSAGTEGSANGTGAAARFDCPWGIATDTSGTIIVADRDNHTIRMVTPEGVVTTLAGTAGLRGNTNGPVADALFYSPYGVAVDGAGNIYIGDYYNHAIRKISNEGIVSTLAGGGGSYGAVDGIGTAAQFYCPAGVAVEMTGNMAGSEVFVAGYGSHTIRRVTVPGGVVTTFAGTVRQVGSDDGTGTATRFSQPYGATIADDGTAYVADYANHTIRKISAGGVVTTFAGLAKSIGSTDATGSAARFKNPADVAVDGDGNVYVADYNNHTIRKITPAGAVTTLAGKPLWAGRVNGTGEDARFYNPEGIAVDSSGNVYVADSRNHAIRKVTPAGVVRTLAGTMGLSGDDDGTGPDARFMRPSGIAMGPNGNLYVAGNWTNKIRKVTLEGVVTTVAGSGAFGSADGTGNEAEFNYPSDVAVDSTGTIFVTSTGSHTIRKISSRGDVTTIGG
ncbi:MAG: hypothetical protein KAI66_12380, partial [Lentisphaeria bacterium]|nr:hypothetical protein [Lentisphaeria bacterium]